MQTITRGLVRYQGPAQEQSELAAAALAATALAGGMPRVAGTLTERQLARHLTQQASKRRRVTQAKLAVIMVGEALALAAGCYIGLLK